MGNAAYATTLSNIGLVYNVLGEKQQALDFSNQALALQLQIDDKFGEVVTRGWLATLYEQEGQLADAIDHLETALTLAVEVKSPHTSAIEDALEQLRAQQGGSAARRRKMTKG